MFSPPTRTLKYFKTSTDDCVRPSDMTVSSLGAYRSSEHLFKDKKNTVIGWSNEVIEREASLL